jgi:uncharacterized protein YqfA (UPF0365 family)
MRRIAVAILLLFLAALLFAPFVVGAVFIAVLAALVVGVFVVVGKRIRRKGDSLVPWLVSLGISAVITTPQIALESHYKHIGAHVFAGVLGWLMLAALLRLAILMADYCRKRFGSMGSHP